MWAKGVRRGSRTAVAALGFQKRGWRRVFPGTPHKWNTVGKEVAASPLSSVPATVRHR